MPLTSHISLGELTVCEDFLDGYREYAIDLSSNLKTAAQWHNNAPEGCSPSRDGRTCTLCALLCSADGLMAATKSALETYDDTEARLKTVRASFAESVPSCAAASPDTLLKSGLAKALFVSIVTAGDILRSEQTKWQCRLRDEFTIATSSGFSSKRPAKSDKRMAALLLPTYAGPRLAGHEANPKFSSVSTGLIAESPSESSVVFVFRRCLSADYPYELNEWSIAASAASDSQVTSKDHLSPMDAKKTRIPKGNAKPSEKGDVPDAPAEAETNAQSKKSSTYHDPNSPDDARVAATPKPQDTALGKQESESPSSDCGTLIVDPRIFRLREEIARSDDARRALLVWCRAWTTDLDGTRPETSLTCPPTAKDLRESPTALTRDMDTAHPRKLSCTTGRPGTTKKDLSHGDDATAQMRFDEQEKLRGRWLMARQRRCKGKKRGPTGRNLQ